MFLLFEMDIPNNVPQMFMYVPTDNINNIDNIQNNSDVSNMSGIAVSDTGVDLEQSPPGMGPPIGTMEPQQNVQQQNPTQQLDPITGEPITMENIKIYHQEMEPLKKLYLMQKLNRLRDTLKESNRTDEQLDLVLKYGSNLSYQTLTSLASNVIMGIRKSIGQNIETNKLINTINVSPQSVQQSSGLAGQNKSDQMTSTPNNGVNTGGL